jgi:hypothetical protein
LASSTLILGLVAFEGSTIPISYRSLLMKPLESVIIYSSFLQHLPWHFIAPCSTTSLHMGFSHHFQFQSS